MEGQAQSSSSYAQYREAADIEDESNSSSTVRRNPVIKLAVQTRIVSVVVCPDGQQFLSGDKDGKIRRWRLADGEEVVTPGDAGSAVRCMAASQDGRLIVAGTRSGRVVVWAAETGQKVKMFACKTGVNSVDISSDGTKIAIAASGAVDVWSLADNEWLWRRECGDLHTVNFSPDGSLCSLGQSSSLSVCNDHGRSLWYIQISARSVAWASDSKQLFALSSDGSIYHVDVCSPVTLSVWMIHSDDEPTCISLSNNGTFLAASANASVSLWDTFTHEQIGLVHHTSLVSCMAISSNYDLVIGGMSGIALCDLRSILSSPYIDSHPQTPSRGTEISIRAMINDLRSQLADSQRVAEEKENGVQNAIRSLYADLAAQHSKSIHLERTVQKLSTQLIRSQQRHGEEIKDLEITIQQLRTQLSDHQQNTNRVTQQSGTKPADSEQRIFPPSSSSYPPFLRQYDPGYRAER